MRHLLSILREFRAAKRLDRIVADAEAHEKAADAASIGARWDVAVSLWHAASLAWREAANLSKGSSMSRKAAQRSMHCAYEVARAGDSLGHSLIYAAEVMASGGLQ